MYKLVFSNHLFLTAQVLSAFPLFFLDDLYDNLDDYDSASLKVIEQAQIELDWRLAYEAIKRVLQGKYVNEEIAISLLPRLVAIVQRTKKYYSKTAAAEIIDYFVPLMNQVDLDTWCVNTALLCEFLPVSCINKAAVVDEEQGLPPSPFRDVPGLFQLWGKSRNAMEVDYYYVSLFSQISYAHRSAGNRIDCFGDQEIRTVFLNCSFSLEVPCGSGKGLEEVPPLFQRYAGIYNGTISSISLVCCFTLVSFIRCRLVSNI